MTWGPPLVRDAQIAGGLGGWPVKGREEGEVLVDEEQQTEMFLLILTLWKDQMKLYHVFSFFNHQNTQTILQKIGHNPS